MAVLIQTNVQVGQTENTYSIQQAVRILAQAEVLQAKAHEKDIETIVRQELGSNVDASLTTHDLQELARTLNVEVAYVHQARRIYFPSVKEQFEDLIRGGIGISARALRLVYTRQLRTILLDECSEMNAAIRERQYTNLYYDNIQELTLQFGKPGMINIWRFKKTQDVALFQLTVRSNFVGEEGIAIASYFFIPRVVSLCGVKIDHLNEQFSHFSEKYQCSVKYAKNATYVPGE